MEDFKKWARNEIERAKEKISEEWQIKTYYATLNIYEQALDEIEAMPECNEKKVAEYLKRLLNGYPMTPITDDPDEWEPINVQNDSDDVQYYRAKRRPSLLKRVSGEEVKYVDEKRYERIDVDSYSIVPVGFCASVMDTILPIEMPYLPYDMVKIYSGEFEYKGVKYIGISHIRLQNGLVTPVDLFFEISDDPEKDEKVIKNIDKKEFNKFKKRKEGDQNG